MRLVRTRRDRIGMACWDHALDLETEPEKWRLIWETFDSRKPFRDFVYCTAGGNGSPMYVKASGKPVLTPTGIPWLSWHRHRCDGNHARTTGHEASLPTVEADLAHVIRLTLWVSSPLRSLTKSRNRSPRAQQRSCGNEFHGQEAAGSGRSQGGARLYRGRCRSSR